MVAAVLPSLFVQSLKFNQFEANKCPAVNVKTALPVIAVVILKYSRSEHSSQRSWTLTPNSVVVQLPTDFALSYTYIYIYFYSVLAPYLIHVHVS